MHSCNQRNTSCFPVAAAAGLNHLPTSNKFLYWHACGVFPAKRDFASGDLPSLYIAARRGQWNKRQLDWRQFVRGSCEKFELGQQTEGQIEGMKHSLWDCKAYYWLILDHAWLHQSGMLIRSDMFCHFVKKESHATGFCAFNNQSIN